MCQQGAIAPGVDDTECLHRNVQQQQGCCCCGEKQHNILPDFEDEDPMARVVAAN